MVAATVALALLAGCGGGGGDDEGKEPSPSEQEAAAAVTTPNIVQPGAPGEPSRTLTPEEAEKAVETPVTKADIEFAQDMIHHHAQAIEMTNLVPSRAASRSVKLMAERMQRSQEAEIEIMEKWLRDQNAEPPSDHDTHGGKLMPGMLTEAQMKRLESADGRRFDRLFLRYMTKHHRGALQMVVDLREAGGSLQSEIDKIAREIATDQEIEILRMRDLLSEIT